MAGNFRERLLNHELLLGTMVTLTTPSTAEIFAELGFDWLFVDGEHGPLETSELCSILQTVGHRLSCVVRVPAADEIPIKKTLDLGADGVIVPMVNTVEDAANVVKWSRYAPLGSRGVGLARAHGYGLSFEDYVNNANDRVAVIVQTEHYKSVDNIEKIVEIEGIDAIQLGPYDLAASMGKMGQVGDPEVVQAVQHVIQTCKNAKMPIGWFGVSGESVKPYIDQGCTLITASVDTILLANAARDLLKQFR